jgi:hypothetical protein
MGTWKLGRGIGGGCGGSGWVRKRIGVGEGAAAGGAVAGGGAANSPGEVVARPTAMVAGRELSKKLKTLERD